MGEETRNLRAAVVGLGLGRNHVRAFAADERVDLVALCDANAQRLERNVAEFAPVKCYTDLREMLERERLDVVSICTPDWLHAELGIMALRTGVHVISTKPMTTTIEDAQRFIAAAEASGRQLMVAHERRFHPRYMAIKRALDDGLLGKLFYLEIDYFSHKGRQFTNTPWYKSAEHPRAAMLGTGSHCVDLMRWYGGEVAEVWGAGNHLAYPDFPADDCVIGVFKLVGGAIGKVTQTYASMRGTDPRDLRVTLHGTKGSIEDERLFSRAWYPDESDIEVADRKPWREVPPVESSAVSHHAIIRYFIDCLLSGRAPAIDGREGARTVAACLAAVDSAASGQPVRPVRF